VGETVAVLVAVAPGVAVGVEVAVAVDVGVFEVVGEADGVAVAAVRVSVAGPIQKRCLSGTVLPKVTAIL
jgi:hypothetical protein